MVPRTYKGKYTILDELYERRILNYTPLGTFENKIQKCDDDLYILEEALTKNALIVSNDLFKDYHILDHNHKYKGKYKDLIENK